MKLIEVIKSPVYSLVDLTRKLNIVPFLSVKVQCIDIVALATIEPLPVTKRIRKELEGLN